MNETLDNILAFLKAAWKRQKYEYNVMQVNGTEENRQIKIANSIEYTFINSGNTLCIINDRFFLYPEFAGRGVHKHTFTMNKNEVDVSVWEYQFKSLRGDFVAGFETNPIGIPSAALLAKYDSVGQAVPDFNMLQVIVKKVSAM